MSFKISQKRTVQNNKSFREVSGLHFEVNEQTVRQILHRNENSFYYELLLFLGWETNYSFRTQPREIFEF